MTSDPLAPVQPGDKAPFWYGMLGDGGFHSAEAQLGQPGVLILAGAAAPGAIVGHIAAFAARASAIQRIGADAVLLVAAHPRWATAALPDGGPLLVHCPTAAPFAAAAAEPERPCVLAVDRTQRVVARFDGGKPDAVAAAAVAALAALPSEPAREVGAPAPVLIVPNLIGAEFRCALIDHFEASAHVDGAMASMDAEGRPVSRLDADKKRRRDCTIQPGTALHSAVLLALERRLLPEIRRVFQAEVAHIDRILIARYDDTGGYFRRHRDNAADHVAFRQFALSLNLNTGDYEGGGLVFPEFNDHVHQPPAGAACVFSASLLHEATPVTRGVRYVLLSFLHDSSAEARRVAQIAAATSTPQAA